MLRIEDIDTPRVVHGSAARIMEDLEWLGLDWDEGPILQSSRAARYEAAIETLRARGLVYPCDCSRAEIARAASAPHAGEETIYPGICRERDARRAFKRPPALRLRVPDGARVVFDDALRGRIEEDVGAAVGDFVLRRGDDVFAYQLAVAVDDVEMRIGTVVRADDLLGSTARQLLLMKLLGHADLDLPGYVHVPLVVAPDGERLAKRTRGATVRELAARGISRETILGTLAHGLGLVPDRRPRSAGEVTSIAASPAAWRRMAWPIPIDW